ncbi:VOC family protein [Aeromonas sp. S16(2024)]|uniref:VOC family protein n=1 Tax=Aeromonas sp. S16(2024) TaxID=3242889 RepID=UPI0035275109
MMTTAKNRICLWYDGDAEEAARFYASLFPDSAVDAVHRAPADYPAGKQGDVLTVEFRVMGIPCLGLNGGPEVSHSWTFSFQVATQTQAETDHYWHAIIESGGQGSECGWCQDKWGISWQITPSPSPRRSQIPRPRLNGRLGTPETTRPPQRVALCLWVVSPSARRDYLA